MRFHAFVRSYEFLALLLAGAAVLSLLAVPTLPRPLALLGLVPGVLYYLIASRRERRRQRVLRQPFPLSWREVLVRRVPLYRQLDVKESQRFEQEIQLFLAEQRVYPLHGPGAPGQPDELWRHFPDGLTDEHRVLIAASAATLLIGRQEWRLPTTRDVVIYPMPFAPASDAGETSPFGNLLVGQVHAFGPILLSLPDLLRAYPLPTAPTPQPPLAPLGLEFSPLQRDESPPGNVGIHEFAHVLDFMGGGGRAGGLPAVIPPRDHERWHPQLEVEQERLRAGQSVLNPYGLHSDAELLAARRSHAELFAVAVEAFFMDPLRLRTLHPDLYGLLRELFNQDPAARILPRHAHWILRPWFALRPGSVRPPA